MLLGNNKFKKMNKLYQDYQKEKLKLTNVTEGMKAQSNFAGLELDNGNVVTFKKVRTSSETKTTSKKVQPAAAEEEQQEKSPKKGQESEPLAENWEDMIPDDWEDNTAW